MTTDLTKQVEAEAREIANAPIIPAGGLIQRCYFCGALVQDVIPAHDWTPEHNESGQSVQPQILNERYRGVACCGGGYVR